MTPPEKRALPPWSALRAVINLAQFMLDDWAGYETTEAALAQPTVAAARGSGVTTSDIPDPTGNAVISHSRIIETELEITEALGHLRAAERNMHAVRGENPVTAQDVGRAKRAARCDGSIDPTCTDLTARDGLCWRCYNQRRNRRNANP